MVRSRVAHNLRIVCYAKSTHHLRKHLHARKRKAQVCWLIRIREFFIEIDKLCPRNMGGFEVCPSRNNIVGLILAWQEMSRAVKENYIRIVEVFS